MFISKLIEKVRPAPLQVLLLSLLGLNRRLIVKSDGLRFFVDPTADFGRRIAGGGYEPEMKAIITEHLEPGGIFFDLGANEGYYTVIASKLVGPAGRVVAVEPQGRLGAVILKNLSLNGCANVTVVQCAIAARSGETEIHLAPSTNTGSSSVFQIHKYPMKRETVPCYTLSDFLALSGLKRIDLAKIDIEGAEYELLMASRDVLMTGKLAKIVIEFHPKIFDQQGYSEALLHQHIVNCGYALASSEPCLYVFNGSS